MFDAHRPKYAFNKGSCAETKYANDYVIMTHKSPFMIKDKLEVPAGGAKKWDRLLWSESSKQQTSE